MRPITLVLGPFAAASATAIALSQTPGAAGPLILNGATVIGGVAILDKPRRIAIASAGNDSALIWTIVGTDWAGNRRSETLAGGNIATVNSVLDYATVISITASVAPAGAVTAGTAAGGSAAAPLGGSSWIRCDEWADPPLGVQIAPTGTVNFTVQHCFDEGPDSLVSPLPLNQMFWDTSLIVAGGVGGTSGITFSIATAPLWMRVLMVSGTGSLRMVVTQYNVVEV
jgi:hypothetical protein